MKKTQTPTCTVVLVAGLVIDVDYHGILGLWLALSLFILNNLVDADCMSTHRLCVLGPCIKKRVIKGCTAQHGTFLLYREFHLCRCASL